ncbi:MAG: flotillin family protein [Planctomycetes bacterium]|nr:flotillin family protein [Planctomycetota bacterium]
MGALVAIAVIFVLILVFLVVIMAQRYKRCPSNKILVVFGKGVGGAAKTIHGGAAFIWPLLQDFSYLSLDPMPIDIDLRGALTKKNIRVNVPCSFTIAIGVRPELMHAAAERLLGLDDRQIQNQAMEIIVGQLRLVVATLAIEEINQDREKFLNLVHENVGVELHKIGLEVINVNIRDITDESGYIDAIGKRAAAEAINAAKIEVAQEEKKGASGEAKENRERIVAVAAEQAIANEGKKKADRDQRMAMAKLEAESVSAEATATREQEVKVAAERAQAEAGKKEADRIRRIKVSEFEAQAVEGENTAKARIAQQNAMLAEAEAESRKRSEVARADATRTIFERERALESAKLEKEIVVHEEIAKRQIEIQAGATAEKTRLEAQGQADAILARYNAEAEGIKRVLEAKAAGYRDLIAACSDRPDIAPTLLMIEKMPEIVAEQVKAVQNLKIDKVTVWDSGGSNGNGKGGTAGFLSSLIGALPQVHELAEQAGIKLPSYLGSMEKNGNGETLSAAVEKTKK